MTWITIWLLSSHYYPLYHRSNVLSFYSFWNRLKVCFGSGSGKMCYRVCLLLLLLLFLSHLFSSFVTMSVCSYQASWPRSRYYLVTKAARLPGPYEKALRGKGRRKSSAIGHINENVLIWHSSSSNKVETFFFDKIASLSQQSNRQWGQFCLICIFPVQKYAVQFKKKRVN